MKGVRVHEPADVVPWWHATNFGHWMRYIPKYPEDLHPRELWIDQTPEITRSHRADPLVNRLVYADLHRQHRTRHV
jgi:hypothetical protein